MKLDRRVEFWKKVLAGTNLPNNNAVGKFGQSVKPLRFVILLSVNLMLNCRRYHSTSDVKVSARKGTKKYEIKCW